jgi:hypothetical protein
MVGVVTKRTILQHPFLMLKLCGVRGLWRVLTAKRSVPFLTVLVSVGRI